MASPTPDAPPLNDSKSRDLESEKEQKLEVNGQKSPVEVEPEAEAPKASGDGKSNEQSAEDGVTSDDVKMGNGDNESDAKSSGDAPTKPVDEEAVASQPEAVSPPQSAESEAKQKVAPKDDVNSKSEGDDATTAAPESSDDVEMTDATPANDGSKTDEPKVAEEKPTDDKPADDTPSEDKPTEEKPTDEETSEKPSKESSEVPMDENRADDAQPQPAEEASKQDDEQLPAEKVNDSVEGPTSPAEEAPLPGSEVDLGQASMSQLAIDSTEDAPVAKPSREVNMEDAPAASESSQSSKVAREREDDPADEPAPKRAKTEPKDDEPAATALALAPATTSAPASASPTDLAEPSQEESPLKSLSKWNDAETDAKELTPFRRREIRKVLARVKKTKHGGHFRDSVQKMWPGLWESYVEKIDKPTDLSVIDRTLRDPNGPYVTLGDFRKHLSLMYDNTRSFNGPIHHVTHAALVAIRSVWEDVLPIPDEEPVKPKSAPKPKPPRESRTFAPVDTVERKPSTAAPASAPVAAADTKSNSSAYEETSHLRRASTTTDGDRPKRTVRAPKPKDIDYSTTKPSRKKLKPELQFCDEVLAELMHPKNKIMNTWFLAAVDAVALNVPEYYSFIKKPMDLGKVSRMLAGGEITNVKEFDKNVRLIFTNCYQFNGAPDQGSAVSYAAKQLEGHYNSLIKNKDAWLAKHAKANAPAATSNASDDDDEEDDDFEGGDAAPPGIDPSKEVKELEAKMREETGKLTDLFAADTPNQSMIDVQQGILKMIQEALLKAKKSLADYRQKTDKSGKKSSKQSKPKPSGSSTVRKPSGSSSQPKKAAPKKAAPKKTLTAADKDQIANAINDLEYPHLDRAIDIIKRDTGQAENTDGELELDIDQLSNEALLKLWDLCKKVLSGFGKDSTAAPVSSSEVARAAPSKKPAPTATKPKKNKPMSAREQEERIAQLRGLRDLYKPGQEPGDASLVTQAPTPTADSSDDSDSEEE